VRRRLLPVLVLALGAASLSGGTAWAGWQIKTIDPAKGVPVTWVDHAPTGPDERQLPAATSIAVGPEGAQQQVTGWTLASLLDGFAPFSTVSVALNDAQGKAHRITLTGPLAAAGPAVFAPAPDDSSVTFTLPATADGAAPRTLASTELAVTTRLKSALAITADPMHPKVGEKVAFAVTGFDKPDDTSDLDVYWNPGNDHPKDTGHRLVFGYTYARADRYTVRVDITAGGTLTHAKATIAVGDPAKAGAKDGKDGKHAKGKGGGDSGTGGGGGGAGGGGAGGSSGTSGTTSSPTADQSYTAPTLPTYAGPLGTAAAATPTPATPKPAHPSHPTTPPPAQAAAPVAEAAAAVNAQFAAPTPPLAVTTQDPVVSGELLSGPASAAAAGGVAGANGAAGSTGTGAGGGVRTVPDVTAPPVQPAAHHDGGGGAIPNAVWEIALLLLVVATGWWLERRSADAPRAVSLP